MFHAHGRLLSSYAFPISLRSLRCIRSGPIGHAIRMCRAALASELLDPRIKNTVCCPAWQSLAIAHEKFDGNSQCKDGTFDAFRRRGQGLGATDKGKRFLVE